jgi:hypothetical protein
MASETVFMGDVAFSTFGASGAMYSFKDTTKIKGEESITTVQVDVKDKVGGTIVAWGTSNDYPQKIMEQVKLNGALSAAMRFRRKAHYGNGANLMTHGVTEDGKHDYKVVPLSSQPDIMAFFNRSQMSRFFQESIADLEYWGIMFPEYILSNDYTKITRVKRQTAAWCRFEVMNPKTGLVENVYISEKFGKASVSVDSEWVSKVPLIDSYWSAEETREYCKANKLKKFIRPEFYPLIDQAYYPEPEWHTVTKSGWLEVANSVPKFKQNLFKNQVSIKFHIEVDEEYFTKMYAGKWAEFTYEQKKVARTELTDAINEHLSKPENAGKSLSTPMWIDDKGNQVSSVKITAIDDKFKDGSYLPEAEAANSETLFAANVDPSMIGAGIPGGKLGAGSGSDKNAAFNILCALYKSDRETTVAPYNFIRDYNGWDSQLQLNFENTILTTLDKNPTGAQKTTS